MCTGDVCPRALKEPRGGRAGCYLLLTLPGKVCPPPCPSCAYACLIPAPLSKGSKDANSQVPRGKTSPCPALGLGTHLPALVQRLGLLVSLWWLFDILRTSLRGLGEGGLQPGGLRSIWESGSSHCPLAGWGPGIFRILPETGCYPGSAEGKRPWSSSG